MTRSSCRAREAAFGRTAVVKSGSAFFPLSSVLRIGEDFVRTLPASNAASQARQLLRIAYWLNGLYGAGAMHDELEEAH
ncbi:hypothetical protein BK659_10045 [Pseudomonas brassicacearum]|uniref:Uncharacterized protein n=1 Tax=Pseudomonas brassicacearum TaxID=930166 RepID=A0A423H839_9PSED|nr:hypothetical protein BK659_10045 [Pseudomonas brassicacearum]